MVPVSDSRRLVYVSGAPGSGKTSLAVPLAAELGYPLLAKDTIKETLHDALGAPEPDRARSRRLGAAAMELLWALAADAPAVVIEANFRPRSEYERAKLSGLAGQPVEVHCTCPPEVAVQRYNARVTHPVHGAGAQLVAHLHGMEGVRGSNPLSSTDFPQFSAVSRVLSD